MIKQLEIVFLKYKLLHIIMWLLVGLSTFLAYYDNSAPLIPQISNAAMVILASLLPFYTTAHFLIPRFLYKKKYLIFIGLLAALIVVSGFFMLLSVRTVDHFFDTTKPIIQEDPARLRFDINIFVWTCLIAAVVAAGLKITIDSFRLRKKLLETEKEKISTELNFLRSQINPHFLFNVMNTIYFQIDKENIQARASVEKLSEMLRYQLYDCTTDKIEILKEIDFIKNYVSIQTLRMEKGSDIQLYTTGHMNGYKIPPLLILPIVENAFKHVSHFKDSSLNKIHILLQQQEHDFVIEVSNSFDSDRKSVV